MVANSYVYWDYTTAQAMVAKLFASIPASELPTGSTATKNQLKPYFLSCKGSYTFTNFSTATVFLDLYDLHPKQSVSVGPDLSWASGDIIEQGDTSTTTSPQTFQISSVPQESTEFMKMWKIDKITRLEMTGGQTHVHRINYGRNKAIPNEVLQQTDSFGPTSTVYGLSRALMWTTVGQPVKDTGTGASAGVTTASTELGIVVELQYRWSMLQFPSKQNITSSTIIPATGNVQSFINELSDTIVANLQV